MHILGDLSAFLDIAPWPFVQLYVSLCVFFFPPPPHPPFASPPIVTSSSLFEHPPLAPPLSFSSPHSAEGGSGRMLPAFTLGCYSTVSLFHALQMVGPTTLFPSPFPLDPPPPVVSIRSSPQPVRWANRHSFQCASNLFCCDIRTVFWSGWLLKPFLATPYPPPELFYTFFPQCFFS